MEQLQSEILLDLTKAIKEIKEDHIIARQKQDSELQVLKRRLDKFWSKYSKLEKRLLELETRVRGI